MGCGTEYCISAGKFAQLCGTTRDTLRYYHSQGILVPQRDETNGYHYYSYAQIASYYFITTFRQLGCSVAEIEQYLWAGQQEAFDRFVEQQYRALLEQRAELERRISIISGTRRLLESIRESDTGRPCIRSLPAGLRIKLTPVLSSPATTSGEIITDLQRHLAGCKAGDAQTFPVGVCMDRDDFAHGRYVYRKLFSFAGSRAQGDSVPLPGEKIAAMVCRDSDGDISDAYRALWDFVQAQDAPPCSDVYCLSIVNVIDPHATRRYLKFVFIFLS